MQEFKYVQIIDTIMKELDSKVWMPGEKIASERDLVIRYGVSRITIKKAIEELISRGFLIHYPKRKGTFVPSQSSQNKFPQPNLIGVAIDDVSGTFGSSLLRGIEDYLWNQKVHTVICNGDRDFQKVEDYFHSLLQKNIDGVIFSPVIAEDDYIEKNREIIQLLKSQKVPYVMVDRTIPGIESHYVLSNHRESAALLTSALIKAGHRKILLLKGLSCSSMDERENGFIDALIEAGIPETDGEKIILNDNLLHKTMDPGELIKLENQLSGISDFTAVIALNNRLLNGFLKVMDARSQHWRDQITLAIHDQLSLDIHHKEEIFQIIQPTYEIGKEAARLLFQTIKEKSTPSRTILLQSKLKIGKKEI